MIPVFTLLDELRHSPARLLPLLPAVHLPASKDPGPLQGGHESFKHLQWAHQQLHGGQVTERPRRRQAAQHISHHQGSGIYHMSMYCGEGMYRMHSLPYVPWNAGLKLFGETTIVLQKPTVESRTCLTTPHQPANRVAQ